MFMHLCICIIYYACAVFDFLGWALNNPRGKQTLGKIVMHRSWLMSQNVYSLLSIYIMLSHRRTLYTYLLISVQNMWRVVCVFALSATQPSNPSWVTQPKILKEREAHLLELHELAGAEHSTNVMSKWGWGWCYDGGLKGTMSNDYFSHISFPSSSRSVNGYFTFIFFSGLKHKKKE